MTTLNEAFIAGKVVIPYFTFGYPSITTTKKLVKESFDNGAGIVEIGFPFSDPIADGPVIQASHHRVLTKQPDINLHQLFDMIVDVKKTHLKPIVVMLSVNSVHAFGISAFFKAAKKSGCDGVIIPDLSLENSDNYYDESIKFNVPLIFLISLITPKDRLEKIVKKSKGFIYVVSTLGTTGERKSFNMQSAKVVKAIKQSKDIPVAIGFGISTPEHVSHCFMCAEGAIIGSYLSRLIQENEKNTKKMINLIGKEVRKLTRAKATS